MRGTRPELEDLHLHSDDEEDIEQVDERDGPPYNTEAAQRELEKDGKEAPPRKNGIHASFCALCGHYREQWSASQGCECFRRCNTCTSKTCNSCVCRAPPEECYCEETPEGKRTWCDLCLETCNCTDKGERKCTHPGRPTECECPKGQGRWISLVEVNQGAASLCPEWHEWRKLPKSKNRKSNVTWHLSALARVKVMGLDHTQERGGERGRDPGEGKGGWREPSLLEGGEPSIGS